MSKAPFRVDGRQLVLIDIENIVGSSTPSETSVAFALTELEYLLSDFHSSQVVIGCSHRTAKVVAFMCPTFRHLWQSGPNGADFALLRVLTDEMVAERFKKVVICSGDGIFADVAARLGSVGVCVSVVSLEGHLSNRLRLAAKRVIELHANSGSVLGEPA